MGDTRLRAPDAAQRAALAKRCAAEPGPMSAGGARGEQAEFVEKWVPALRSGIENAAARPGHHYHLANRYAPPFSTERWNAGRACMRPSHAFRFGYGPILSNTFAISPTKLIWISAPVRDRPTKNSRPCRAPSI